MKRLVFALLVCGLGSLSFGQLATYTKLVVLKGAAADTVHYVLSDGADTSAAAIAQREALGVDAMALAAKVKTYYFLVVELTYTPQIVSGKWTGEGTLSDLDLWTMGAVEYGIGRHTSTGAWNSTLPYAYDIGATLPFWFGSLYWYCPKAKIRAGDADVFGNNVADTYQDERKGTAVLVYGAKLTTDKVTGHSWYEPSISSLTISYTQWMQQLVGTPAAWRDVQFGAGKIAFKTEAKMTAKANLKDPTTGENIGLALVAEDIAALLEKGGYGFVLPNLDPDDLY